MNKKYVITEIYKEDAYYRNKEEILEHYIVIDPARIEQSKARGDWKYVENEDLSICFYAIKLLPFSQYKKLHPNSHVRKASV